MENGGEQSLGIKVDPDILPLPICRLGVGCDRMHDFRKTNLVKPIRVFLQDGTNDLNNEHGNWHLANEQMLSSLQWANANADEKKIAGARYDIRYEWGDGAHSDVHGGWLLPGILRWMFGK